MPHSKLPIGVQASHNAMVRLLQDGGGVLAGYPVGPIIHGCWLPSGAGVSVPGCMLASRVLGAWVRHLDTDLELLRPGSGSAIERIHRQTSEARQALVDLLGCVSTLLDGGRSAELLEPARINNTPSSIRDSGALLANVAAPSLHLETEDLT